MADEFVDFYEALDLPLEADRKEVRKRINEVYLEAQRNLDHRNFQTRVKHQEMFEVVLPRARYILLDEGRRDDYDRLVRAFREANAPAPVAPPSPAPAAPHEKAFGKGDTSGFRLAEGEEAPAGKAPPVEALPGSTLDPAQMAMQRDEMWAKWKQGLEAAITHEEPEAKPAPPRPAAAAPSAAPGAASLVAPAQEAAEATPQRKPRPQASSISFNFGDNGSSAEDDEETARAKAFELERQKTERKRAVMKEILDEVSLKGTIIGGLGTAIPLGALLIYLIGRFYPRDAAPQLPLPSTLAWIIGLAIVLGGAFFAAREAAKAMRHKATLELSMLSIEELLRRVGRTY